MNDWAADLQGVAYGRGVYLYAAPVIASLPITARVETVGPACRGGVTASGGHRVTVAFYHGAARIGTLTFAHIKPAVAQNSIVGRWGTLLGTVGAYTRGGCWGGPHVHVELSSQRKYACFNKGWSPGQQMAATNFIGFIGGNYASARRRACP